MAATRNTVCLCGERPPEPDLAGDYPDGAPITHLGLNKQGQPRESGFYMRSIRRVYLVSPFPMEDVGKRLEADCTTRRSDIVHVSSGHVLKVYLSKHSFSHVSGF